LRRGKVGGPSGPTNVEAPTEGARPRVAHAVASGRKGRERGRGGRNGGRDRRGREEEEDKEMEEEEEEEGERHRGGPLAPGTVAVVRPLREKVREVERRS
jgi:hypothetical protein